MNNMNDFESTTRKTRSVWACEGRIDRAVPSPRSARSILISQRATMSKN